MGVVGEIYVKFSPLGNNNLEDFLLSEGAEPVVPGLTDFIIFKVFNREVRCGPVRRQEAEEGGGADCSKVISRTARRT